MRAQAKTISAIAAWNTAWGLALEGTDGARRLEANFVGRDYFPILGVPRRFWGACSPPTITSIGGHAPLVVMLSEATWRQEFGADPAIVGKDVRLQNRVFSVVGVMPASFTDVAASQGIARRRVVADRARAGTVRRC